MVRVGMIGYGAIGSAIVDGWPGLSSDYELAILCVRPQQVDMARESVPPGTKVVTSIDEVLAASPELLIEAAGHQALWDAGTRALRAGCNVCTLSIGALANEELEVSLRVAATEGGGRLIVPPGALGGFDGLVSMRESGLQSVFYRSIKPARAWRGTPAEDMVELDTLSEAVTFFEGSARDAARTFPKNANLAAAVALAGLGFERTRVELIADPTADTNSAHVLASSPAAELEISLKGRSFHQNPKSSAIVGASVIGALKNAASGISFL